SLGRLTGYRLRWIWVGAFALVTFLSLSSAARRLEHHSPVTLVATARDVSAVAPVRSTWMQLLRSVTDRVDRALDGPLALAARSLERVAVPFVVNYAVISWIVASLTLATTFGTV